MDKKESRIYNRYRFFNINIIKEFKEPEKLDSIYDFIAFVDGSYDQNTKIYGAAVIVYNKEEKIKIYHTAGFDKSNVHSICGELEAAKLAVKKAMEENKKNIVIYHDSQSISDLCIGKARAKNKYLKEYAEFMKKASENLKINFIKLRGHRNESIYNDMADDEAASALWEFKNKL